VATVLAVLLLLTFGISATASAQGDPSVVGQWSSVMIWPQEAIHMQLLPTGKIMFWGPYPIDTPQIWDPATSTATPAATAPYPPFCAGHSFLANGLMMVAGGLVLPNMHGSDEAFLYDPAANTWTELPEMNDGRYYPTSTTLANGDVLITAGLGTTTNNALPQVWQVASSSWRDLSSAQLVLPTYPKMFLAPNGKVFMAGPQPMTRYLDSTGTGAWSFVAQTQYTGLRDYGPAVMYDDGKVMIAGGSRPPTATAEIIDLNASTPAWKYTGSMAYPRRQNNLTLLPDGTVLVTGGSDGNNTLFDDDTNPVYAAELWNPATGQWTTMASNTVYRGYHSTALLLPDGSVLTAGGDKANPGKSAEIFSPPYLFKGARPTITSAPSNVTYGQTFFVETPDAADITQVNWIRLSAVTHTFNMNQRINHLSFSVSSDGTGLNVTAPVDGNHCPPGDYMFFILNGNGVPSVAPLIRITATTAPDFTISATPPSQTVMQGDSTTYTAAIAALNGFTGTVTFGASGLPSGASASFIPTSVPSAGSSAMTITTASTTPTGTYAITITGTSGSTSHSTTVTLVVTSSATPDFSISATPPSLTVARGTKGSYTVTVSALNGFNGTVTFSLAGLPANTVLRINPTSVTGSGSTTLVVYPQSSAPPGTYSLTVTGTSGALTHDATMTLIVQ
jgi:galactose oxidase